MDTDSVVYCTRTVDDSCVDVARIVFDKIGDFRHTAAAAAADVVAAVVAAVVQIQDDAADLGLRRRGA